MLRSMKLLFLVVLLVSWRLSDAETEVNEADDDHHVQMKLTRSEGIKLQQKFLNWAMTHTGATEADIVDFMKTTYVKLLLERKRRQQKLRQLMSSSGSLAWATPRRRMLYLDEASNLVDF